MLCTVVTASRAAALADGLTYDTGGLPVTLGCLVRVPLRKGTTEGIVVALDVPPPQQGEVRAILSLFCEVPLVSAPQLRLAQWMAREYRCSLRQTLQLFLPAPPWRNVLPKPEVAYTLGPKADLVQPRTPAQQFAISVVRERGGSLARDLKDAGVSLPIVKRLVTLGVLAAQPMQFMPPEAQPVPVLSEPQLNGSQSAAREAIAGDLRPAVLFGVTGSGKTAVYASVAAATLRQERQVIILVPEILLTEHLVHHFRALVPAEHIAVLHSKLTPAARREVWRRIWMGDVSLIIGSRSALFAPCRRLGLVVIDEEHEWTYKNEQAPRYNSRETAEILCRLTRSRLVMGSATPSLEAWWRAKNGYYQLLRMPDRFNDVPLPKVEVVDLLTADTGTIFPFTTPLLQAIGGCLERKEQVILFLNRRGLAPAVLCRQCRRRLVSSETGLPFVLHRQPDGSLFLLDHMSGLTAPVPAACPSCGSTQLLPVGAGTQRIETLVKKAFPKAKVLRADRDTLRRPEDIRATLKAMEEGRADILVGTQAVAKGLDLPGVTLAVVLVADVGLSLPSFRSGERVFQLLTQLAGRPGRRTPGQVILQTFRVDAPEVQFASGHKVEEYLEQELEARRLAGYPPFVRIVRFLFRGVGPEARAREFLARIQALPSPPPATVAPTFYGNGKEWHVMMRCADPQVVLDQLPLQGVIVDVDPVDCL
jgi:primosomal protein N' (replication factor Y)